jgi:hypothetical protein
MNAEYRILEAAGRIQEEDIPAQAGAQGFTY